MQSSAPFVFGGHRIEAVEQIFVETPLSVGIVNLKPLVAGHADRTPRPPPPDDGLDAAEPELRSTSQWWPVNTDLAPFSGAPGEVHNSASI